MNKLEKQVLRLIGENVDSPDVFSDITQIRDSVNDAIQEICVLTGSVRHTYYLPLVSERGLYRLRLARGEVAWITDAWLASQRRRLQQTDLVRLQSYNPRWLIDTGTPESYFQIGSDVIGVYRRPTGGGDVLELTMAVVPARYTRDNDRIHLRSQFEWATVHYAVSEYYASRGDARTATAEFERYLRAVGLQQQYPLSGERVRTAYTGKEPFLTDG